MSIPRQGLLYIPAKSPSRSELCSHRERAGICSASAGNVLIRWANLRAYLLPQLTVEKSEPDARNARLQLNKLSLSLHRLPVVPAERADSGRGVWRAQHMHKAVLSCKHGGMRAM